MKKQRKLRGLQRKKMVAGYLFIMPFILGFLAFMVKPFLQSLYMSFCNVEISSTGFHMIFAGMANYIRAFTIDTEFNRLLVEEIAKMTYNSLAIMVFSFFVALILNQKFKGRAFVRAVFFLPVILSSGVILGIESDNSLLASVQDAIQDSIGTASITDTIQNILVTSGVGIKAFEKVFEIVDGVYDVAIASGIQIIIFLSGLQTISTSMYEAASLEGCTKWECLWKVTFPMISSLFLVNWVYTIIDFCMRSDNEVMEKISNTMIVDMNFLKKDAKEIVFRIIRFFMLFGMCFLILQPILNKISVSFMAEKDLYNPMVIAIPENVTTANYELASQFMDYWRTLGNTILVSLTIALLQIAVCTVVGYGFARFEFPFKKFWFLCVMLVIVIPPQTISTSLHLHFRYFDILGIIQAVTGHTLNLRGSVLPYYLMSAGCMGLKNGLYIYMIRQFFRNIPKEMEEAAYVDGCGMLETFVKIMLPDAKPILTSCFLFAFVWQWTDSFYSKMFLGNIKLLSIQLAQIGEKLGNYLMYTLHRATGASVGYTQCIVSTGTLMVILPILILYLFAQKGFVESLSSTGIKM